MSEPGMTVIPPIVTFQSHRFFTAPLVVVPVDVLVDVLVDVPVALPVA